MKKYSVINLSDTDKVLWSQVDQFNAQTVRRNIANTQFIISYMVEPSFITDESITPIQTLNHDQALTLTNGEGWADDSDVD
ncbi:hypothetical protein [uncultured virus]|jgi:hypothetical protein|uniref:Uncharacterized protein n=1 Tax=uncultured virus TaxID=340016 RepID=A0A218MN01_9VIRU|nr:hypothetical protein [uncultured virus]